MEENHQLLEGCKGVQRTPPLNWYFLPKCHFLQFYSSVFLKLAFIIPTERKLKLRTTDSLLTSTTDPSPSLPFTSSGLKFQETEELVEG